MSKLISGPIRENERYLSSYVVSVLDDGSTFWTVSAINLTRKGSRITRSGTTPGPDPYEGMLAAAKAQDAIMGYPA